MTDEAEARHFQNVTLPSEAFCTADQTITRDEWLRRWQLNRPTDDNEAA